MPKFNAAVAEMLPSQAWHLCNLAHCAYFDDPQLSHLLDEVGLDVVNVFGAASTHGYIARGKEFAVLAFRGTEANDRIDWRYNLRAMPERFPGGGWVHKGFREALETVWDPIAQTLRQLNDLPVWITGHSLGGRDRHDCCCENSALLPRDVRGATSRK